MTSNFGHFAAPSNAAVIAVIMLMTRIETILTLSLLFVSARYSEILSLNKTAPENTNNINRIVKRLNKWKFSSIRSPAIPENRYIADLSEFLLL